MFIKHWCARHSSVLSHLILISILWGRCYYYPDFIDEKMKAQRGDLLKMAQERLLSLKKQESQGLNPDILAAESRLLHSTLHCVHCLVFPRYKLHAAPFAWKSPHMPIPIYPMGSTTISSMLHFLAYHQPGWVRWCLWTSSHAAPITLLSLEHKNHRGLRCLLNEWIGISLPHPGIPLSLGSLSNRRHSIHSHCMVTAFSNARSLALLGLSISCWDSLRPAGLGPCPVPSYLQARAWAQPILPRSDSS